MSIQTTNSTVPYSGCRGYLAAYRRLPYPIRLGLTAVLGASIGWGTYEVVFWLNPTEQIRATSSWAIGFVIGVARQHALHRFLTFGGTTPYWSELGRAYAFYSISAVIGAAANYAMTVGLGWHHRLAYLGCLSITALFSLLFLKKLVFSSPQTKEKS